MNSLVPNPMWSWNFMYNLAVPGLINQNQISSCVPLSLDNPQLHMNISQPSQSCNNAPIIIDL